MAIPALHKFPHDPALARLLIAAKRAGDSDIIVHDVHGFQKTYPELLGDVLQTRHLLRAQVSPAKLNERAYLYQENPYVAVTASSGYEFIVAFFAIRAMGGACMPLSPNLSAEETSLFLRQTKAACFLAGTDAMQLAQDKIEHHIAHGGHKDLMRFSISCHAAPVRVIDVSIDEAQPLDPSGPGWVILTSGTTGRHKAVALARHCFAPTTLSEPGSTTVSYRPCFWVGGAANLITPMLTGKKLYALRANTTAQELLDAFKGHKITFATFSPWMLKAMKDLLTDEHGTLPEDRRRECTAWFQYLTRLRCSSGMVGQTTAQFWSDLTGHPLENLYAGTEFGGVVATGTSHLNGLGSINSIASETVIKLSEGSRGELRVKSPFILIQYIGDAEATRNVFDEDGFYKSGDLAELRDNEYFLVGRISDQISFYSFRIPIMQVECSLQDLAYISQACVCAVPDPQATELCAAVVRLRNNGAHLQQSILSRIRADLANVLPSCMLPAAIRILDDGEVIPKTQSGKIVRRFVAEKFFANGDWRSVTNPAPGFCYFGNAAPATE